MTPRTSPSASRSLWRQRMPLSTVIVAGSLFVGVGALVTGVLLWTHYGTAVFFEMIASGIAACF